MGFSTNHLVSWGDCDALGIVFYPNFFSWMDGAFHQLTRHLGFDQDTLNSDYQIAGTPLSSADCKFLSPAHYYETLTINIETSDLSRTSWKLNYRFQCEERGIAVGAERRVFVADVNGKLQKTDIPDELRRKIIEI